MASSAMRDRSTGSRVKDRWSARLSSEQCFGEVDRSGVDGVEAVDELAGVAVRIVAGDLEQCLRDRQRGAQFVGGVGCESLLFGDVRFEPREHGVEAVGELAELVVATRQLDPVGERSVRGHAVASVMRVSGASMRPARSHPPTRPNTSRNANTTAAPRSEDVQEGRTGRRTDHDDGMRVDEERTARARSAAGTPTRRRAARRRRA